MFHARDAAECRIYAVHRDKVWSDVSMNTPERSPVLSVVVPAYNEADVLPEFQDRLAAVLNDLGMDAEIVYVDDGSSDSTVQILTDFRNSDPRISIVKLSRNFGKEIALTAGLDHCIGDAIVVIDADLQDPPELIPEFLKHWADGYDVVYATRTKRRGETWLKRTTAAAFYRVVRNISQVEIPQDTGDFRLMSRRALDSLLELREQHRFMKGLFAWIGFRQKAVEYERDPRYAGETSWNYWRLWNFAVEGITSFSIAPLKLSSYIGSITATGAFFYGVFIILRVLILGIDVPGYASLLTVVLFLGGIQLLTLGTIGEYLGRVFNETKNRPLYFVEECLPSASRENTGFSTSRSSDDA
jgi:glycosyltransferase involved in cell wall biosynthesis